MNFLLIFQEKASPESPGDESDVCVNVSKKPEKFVHVPRQGQTHSKILPAQAYLYECAQALGGPSEADLSICTN